MARRVWKKNNIKESPAEPGDAREALEDGPMQQMSPVQTSIVAEVSIATEQEMVDLDDAISVDDLPDPANVQADPVPLGAGSRGSGITRTAPGSFGWETSRPGVPLEMRLPPGFADVAASGDLVPEHGRVYLHRMREAHRRREYAVLERAFSEGIAALPSEGGLYAYLGVVYLSLGALDKAYAVLTRGLAQAVPCRFLLEVLAEVEIRRIHRKPGLQFLNQALEDFPPDVDFLKRVARQAVRTGHLRWAYRRVQEAMQLSDAPSPELEALAKEIRRRADVVHSMARNELARIIAKDIHVPLNTLSNYLDLALREEASEQLRHYLVHMVRQVETLNSIANSVAISFVDKL